MSLLTHPEYCIRPASIPYALSQRSQSTTFLSSTVSCARSPSRPSKSMPIRACSLTVGYSGSGGTRGRRSQRARRSRQKSKVVRRIASQEFHSSSSWWVPRSQAVLTRQPDGKPATIAFVTVAGRTSAVVTELQKLPSEINGKSKAPKAAKAAKSPVKGRVIKRKRGDTVSFARHK